MSRQTLGMRWPTLPRRTQSEQVAGALAVGRSAMLVGDQGVGKTHLADSVLADRTDVRVPASNGIATNGSATTNRATANPAANGSAATNGVATNGVPAGPVVLSLSGASVSRVPSEVLHPWLVRPLGREGASQATEVQRPLVRIDDAHLLSDDLAYSFAQLAREGRAQLLLTLRPAAASRAPWVQLWKDGVADRIDVPAFTGAQTEALLEAALGGPMTTDTCTRIIKRTQGNGFYLRELVRTELEAGTLTESNGVWSGFLDAPPSARVLDLVRSSIAGLEPRPREALDLLALTEALPLRRLVDILDEDALDQLVREGLVVVSATGSPHQVLVPAARICHPMFAEAVRDLVPFDRQRRLYAAVRSTQTSPASRESETPADLLWMVLWALRCGVRESPQRLLSATKAACSLTQWRHAVQVSHAALQTFTPTDPARIDVLALRAIAWRWLSEQVRAAQDLADAERLLQTCPAGPERDARAVRIADLLADLDQFQTGDPDAALGRLQRLRTEASETMSPANARALEVSWLAHLGMAGRFTQSVEPSLQLLTGEGATDPNLLRLVDPTMTGLAQMGRLAEAQAIGERALHLATGSPEGLRAWQVESIIVPLFLSRLWSGDLEACVDIVNRPNPQGYSEHEVFVQVGRGLVASARGQWSDARAELGNAAARYAVRDVTGVGAYVIAAAAVATAATGDAPQARELVRKCHNTRLRTSLALASDLRLHLLDASGWLREPTQADDALSLARWSAQRGLLRTELEALHRAVTAAYLLGTPVDVDEQILPRIRELGRQINAPRPRALVAHAEAIAQGDEDVMLIATRELGQFGLWLPSRGASAALTRREREVAGLAAGGLSSRAIAERFTLSVRTVDSHLSRVFNKLNVRNRQELAAALHR